MSYTTRIVKGSHVKNTLSGLVCAVLVFFLMIGCAPEAVKSGYEKVMEKGEIVVGVKGDTPPFGFRDNDGNLTGFDVELAARIAQRIGVKPTFTPVTSAEKISALETGKVDMVAACMTITRERERLIDFSMPYFETYQSLLVRADSDITDYVALAGKRVGATKGSTGMAMMKIVQPDAVIVPFDGYTLALEALKSGRIDALATDHIILVGLVAGREKEFRIVSRFGWDPYGLGVKENNSALRDRINEALQAMWDEGEFQEVYDKWLGANSKYPTGTAFTITTYPKGNLK